MQILLSTSLFFLNMRICLILFIFKFYFIEFISTYERLNVVNFTDLPPDKEPLDWYTRMKIAAGAAKGVDYLHNEAKPSVIFRDLKPSNILLDKDFNAKLSDFGLAKFGPVGDSSHVSTRIMGTHGYCAPEYFLTGKLTVKSDTFSFGVVLLELITGRKAVDTTHQGGRTSLVAWVTFELALVITLFLRVIQA